MSICAYPGCSKTAKSSCSGCGREHYCSSSCQKADWKIHKSMCPILKKLSTELQPCHEVVAVIEEIRASKNRYDLRVLQHLRLYAEHQFGKQVIGKIYREREDGDRISNWKVEVDILDGINTLLMVANCQNDTGSSISLDNAIFPFLERSLSLLNPWLIHLDSDAGDKIDKLNEDQINFLLKKLVSIEHNMAIVTMNRSQFDISEGHCERSLAYSRRLSVEGEERTTFIFEALKTYCTLRDDQGNYSDALTFAEECYNLVVVAYDPVHIQVQEAAGILIHSLIAKGDLFDGERFAQITYSNLRDSKNGMDQESDVVAEGAHNLADIIHRQMGDLMRAEELAREAVRIRMSIYGGDHWKVGVSCELLAKILTVKSNLGDETRRLFERSLGIFIKYRGPEGSVTASVRGNIGEFYYELAGIQPTIGLKRTQLLLAKVHFEVALKIYSKLHGPNHEIAVQVASRLATVLSELS